MKDKSFKLKKQKTNAQKDVEKTKKLVKENREYRKLVNSKYIESLSGHYKEVLREREDIKVDNTNNIIEKNAEKLMLKQQEENKQNKKEVIEKEEIDM